MVKLGSKFVAIFGLIVCISLSAFAQRFAYIDSEYILNNMPEYLAAQKQMDVLSAKWQKEIDERSAVITKMKTNYQADRVLLTEDMRAKREGDIKDREDDVREFQRSKFGFEGELFKQRSKLIKPIQDRILKAIQSMADDMSLDMLFDKNSQITFLYANTRLDKSNDVLARLGLKPSGQGSQKK